MTGDWWRQTGDGAEIRVRLTPRASRDEIGAAEAGADGRFHLKVWVRAVPEDGRANAALIRLIAKTAGVAKSQVRLISGSTARLKVLRIAGDPVRIAARLELAAR